MPFGHDSLILGKSLSPRTSLSPPESRRALMSWVSLRIKPANAPDPGQPLG